MLPPSSFRKGLVLLAFLCVLPLGNDPRLRAQDTGPTSTPSPEGGPADITFNGPVNNLLDIYEQMSGKHLIRDAYLSGLPTLSFNESGLNKADRLKFIEAFLLLNGVSIIPIDDRTSKAITIGTNKNPRSEGVRLYGNAADIPIDDQVISYYMPLSYISPQEAGQIFLGIAPVHTGYGAYTPAPSAQALILTENASVVRQLIALKELVDVPPAKVVSEFVQLNRADAETVADMLNKLLDQPTSGATGAAAAPAAQPGSVIVPPGIGNDQPMLNERNLLSGPAKIIPDTRSNSLLIVTRPVNMPFLRQMIAQLDQTNIFLVPVRRPLKYVLAQDILPALEAALAQGKAEEDEIKKETTPTTPTGTAAQNQPVNSSSGVNNGSSGGGQSLSSITSPLQAPTQNNVPTVVTIGKTRLMADNRSNSIIVFGSPDAVSRVFDMVDQLDRKPLQVYLATVIGELTVSEGEEFGIDILQKFQKIGQGGLSSSLITPGSATAAAANGSSSTTTTGSAVPEPSSLTSSLGFPLPEGLTLYGAIGTTLNAYVRALETTNRFKVISRPSVYTTNNKLAVIASGSQIPVPGTTVSGFTGSTAENGLTTSSTTTYESVLLELEIVPLINANHEVTLQIRQTNNSEGSSQEISGNEVPTILTQEINTEVTVPDKATIVIGGLISDTSTRKTSGVPWLSDIPVLGYLFKDTSKNKERDELIIMIQPTVVETDADQIAANEAEKQRTILGHEAVDAATGFSEKAPQTLMPHANANSAQVRGATYNSKTGVSTEATPATPPTSTAPAVPATVTIVPTTAPGVVPANSSPAPDVSNGNLPPDLKPPPKPTAP